MTTIKDGMTRIIGVGRLIAILIFIASAGFAQGKQPVDLIVSGGIVVTMDSARTIYLDGSVAVRGDHVERHAFDVQFDEQ